MSCSPNAFIKTIANIRKVDELGFLNEKCFDTCLSNLSYNLILTESGKVYEMGYSSQHDIECHAILSSNYRPLRGAQDLSKYHALPDDWQESIEKPFLRCIKDLSSSEIIQIHAGRISLALSRQNILYIWDCLKMNSMQAIKL